MNANANESYQSRCSILMQEEENEYIAEEQAIKLEIEYGKTMKDNDQNDVDRITIEVLERLISATVELDKIKLTELKVDAHKIKNHSKEDADESVETHKRF